MSLVRQFIFSLVATLCIVILAACGGGSSNEEAGTANGTLGGNTSQEAGTANGTLGGNTSQEAGTTKGSSETSSRLIDEWFASANENKVNGYNSDRSALVYQYATSVGARVSGNSAIIAGSRQSFDSRTSAVLHSFKLYMTDTARSYDLSPQAISEVLSRYESSDIAFIGNSLSNSGANASFIADAQNDIRALYDSARQFVEAF
jgi:hypothetical protein